MRGRAVAWFSTHMSHIDVKVLQHAIGESSGQQVWDSLCALVAPQAWMAQWAVQRVKPSNPLRFCSVVVRAADAIFPISGKKHHGPRIGVG